MKPPPKVNDFQRAVSATLRMHGVLLAVVGFQFLPSCQPTGTQGNPPNPESSDLLEPQASSSFLENCRELKKSDAFRQNVFLCARQHAWAGICMDRDHRLYMVVRSKLPAHAVNQIDEKYRQLQVPPEELRSRMVPDAFILDGVTDDERPVGIFRIPEDAEESFGIELINHLFGSDLKIENQGFQWD